MACDGKKFGGGVGDNAMDVKVDVGGVESLERGEESEDRAGGGLG